MAELIHEDAERRLWETKSPGWPDTAGATRSLRTEWKVENETTRAETVATRLDQALDAMRAHVARGTFTAAQRDNALLLVLRVCIGLVRLARSRFDAVE